MTAGTTTTCNVRPKVHVLGTEIDALTMDIALDRIAQQLQDPRPAYVCVTGVHGVVEAMRNPALAEAYAHSAMNVPDGMPLVWVGRQQGHTHMKRVAGPDLMLEVFRDKRFADVRHYLYGGDDGVARELRNRLQVQCPHARIVGTYTPPFRPLSAEERTAFIEDVKRAKPDILWIGISCPKQEIFMAEMLPLLDVRLMFGVGAAFDYHTGRIRDCAEWIKLCGLQWLHRLLQNPRRLWRRYLRNNPIFLWHITLQLLSLRQYPLTKSLAVTDTKRRGAIDAPTRS